MTAQQFKRGVAFYLYACVAHGFNGAVTAAYSFLGMTAGAAFDPEHFDAPGWKTLAWTFAVSFGTSILWWLKNHPIPEELPETTPPFASTTKIEDGKITTTANEPKVLEPKP